MPAAYDTNPANNDSTEQTTVVLSVASGAGIIQNGTIMMGVHPAGHLNVPGGPRSSGVGVNTTVVGLRYIPTGAESTADGCACEGWGVADAVSGVSGGANEATDRGAFGLTVESFTASSSTARSTVLVGPSEGNRTTFRVTHYYHPSVISNLYQVDVSIENISSNLVQVLYRRVMDWDVEPTAFREYSTLFRGNSTNLYFTSDNGFASANPLAGPSFIQATGTFVDDGPADHGALFDFYFGPLLPGETKFFRTYYGAAGTELRRSLAAHTLRDGDESIGLRFGEANRGKEALERVVSERAVVRGRTQARERPTNVIEGGRDLTHPLANEGEQALGLIAVGANGGLRTLGELSQVGCGGRRLSQHVVPLVSSRQ